MYTVKQAADMIGIGYHKCYAIARDHNISPGRGERFTDADVELIREIAEERGKKKGDELKEIRAMIEEIMEILRRNK